MHILLMLDADATYDATMLQRALVGSPLHTMYTILIKQVADCPFAAGIISL